MLRGCVCFPCSSEVVLKKKSKKNITVPKMMANKKPSKIYFLSFFLRFIIKNRFVLYLTVIHYLLWRKNISPTLTNKGKTKQGDFKQEGRGVWGYISSHSFLGRRTFCAATFDNLFHFLYKRGSVCALEGVFPALAAEGGAAGRPVTAAAPTL